MQMSNPPTNKSELTLEQIIHLCGCAVANLDQDADNYLERIEELEAECLAQIEQWVSENYVEKSKVSDHLTKVIESANEEQRRLEHG